jgi:hypothetical protein
MAGGGALAVASLAGAVPASATSAAESSPRCHVLGVPSPQAVRIVDGAWQDGGVIGGETTEFFPRGAYRVTRCRPDGTLKISQLNGPVPVPGGDTATLTLSQVQPAKREANGRVLYAGRAGIYAAPNDLHWTRVWKRHRTDLLKAVLPPTNP